MASEREHLAGLWQSIFQPAADLTSPELPSLLPDKAFSLRNALVLGWLCHASYVMETTDRSEAFQSSGFEERASESKHNLHWSLVRSLQSPDDQVLVFRGTADLRHWFYNFNTLLAAWPAGGRVHGGFASAYNRVTTTLSKSLTKNSSKRLWITGHSLGGAQATFAATQYDSTAVYTFGCPRIGNPSFALAAETKARIYRVVHGQDLVTTIPYEINFLKELGYKHVGTPVHLRQDQPVLINDETHLPRSRRSWRQALHAVLEGDHVGEPLPAILDHAPSRYVRVLEEAAKH